MQQSKYKDISISAICKKAGISRTGFYRNYGDKDAVLIDYFNQYIKPFYVHLNSVAKKNPEIISRLYFNFIDDHSELFEVIISSGAENIFQGQFTHLVSQFYSDNIKSIPFSDDYAHYWNSFQAAGLYNMTIEWIINDKQTSIDTLVSIAARVGG